MESKPDPASSIKATAGAMMKEKRTQGARKRKIWVIASAECFVVASHVGNNCAVSNEFVHLTLATAVPVSGSAFALLGSSGAETKFSVVALDSVQLCDGRRVRPVAETGAVS